MRQLSITLMIFLMKPLNPKQIASQLAFLLEYDAVKEDYTAQEYVIDFNKRSALKQQEVDWKTWIDIYTQLAEWDLRLDELDVADNLRETHRLEKQECNALFARYIEDNYSDWLVGEDSPVLSVDLLYKHVIPEIQVGKQVFFMVMDCMRLDHWLKIKPSLRPIFSDYHKLSLLNLADSNQLLAELDFQRPVSARVCTTLPP